MCYTYSMPKTIEDHLKTIQHSSNGCWIWQGSVDSRGYGQLMSNSIVWRAHRFFYTNLVREIPPNYQIDHLCKIKLCVNPEHLEAVTQTENIKRSGAWNYNKTKTHCPQGHEYTNENTLFRQNKRTCRICKKNRSKRLTKDV